MEPCILISTPTPTPTLLSLSLPNTNRININNNNNNNKPLQLNLPGKWSKLRDGTTPFRSELNLSRFVTIIESFAAEKDLLQGLKLHAILIKNASYAASFDIKACLASMYLNCGEIQLARKVFDEFSDTDFSLLGDMVVGFARRGLWYQVLEWFRFMVEEGIVPNSVLITVVLVAIGELCALRFGQEVHGYLVKKKLGYGDDRIRMALADMYCKCGDVGSGRRVFCRSMERDVSHWSALIRGYNSSGRLQQAIKSMVRMRREGREGFRPNVDTVASVVSICAQSKALKWGKEIHAYALRHWFLPHVSIISSLMVLYSKCGVMEYSRKLFDGMEQRNVILWTAMIDSYVENGCMYEALGIMRSMQLAEHRADTVNISRMLSVCSKLKLVKLGKEIHGQVLKRDFASVHYVSAELINMYGSCGVVGTAKLVFKAVPVKGSMTWTALIRAYGYKEWYQDAIDLFDNMITNGCAPNHFTFEVVLSICDKAGFVDDAFRIFSLLSRYKIEASKEHCFIMVRLLTRYGKLDEAQRFLQMSSSL